MTYHECNQLLCEFFLYWLIMPDPNNIGLAFLTDQKNLVVSPRRRGIAKLRHDKIAKHQTSRNDTSGDGVWNDCQAPDAGVWHGCQAPGAEKWHDCQTLSAGVNNVCQTLGAQIWQNSQTPGARVRDDCQTPAPWVWKDCQTQASWVW